MKHILLSVCTVLAFAMTLCDPIQSNNNNMGDVTNINTNITMNIEAEINMNLWMLIMTIIDSNINITMPEEGWPVLPTTTAVPMTTTTDVPTTTGFVANEGMSRTAIPTEVILEDIQKMIKSVQARR
jgi:hypothetical protein